MTESLRERVRICSSCHGEDGNSRTAGIPSIAGQPKIFLENQLVLFREGVRAATPLKQPAVAGLTDREISTIAGVFGASAVQAGPGGSDPALAKRGRALAQELGCGSCHLPDFQGREQIPRLAGQREEYLVEAMTGFRHNRRPAADTAMTLVLHGVSDSDIEAMAHYFSRYRQRD
jgi:cytochrome c553